MVTTAKTTTTTTTTTTTPTTTITVMIVITDSTLCGRHANDGCHEVRHNDIDNIKHSLTLMPADAESDPNHAANGF